MIDEKTKKEAGWPGEIPTAQPAGELRLWLGRHLTPERIKLACAVIVALAAVVALFN